LILNLLKAYFTLQFKLKLSELGIVSASEYGLDHGVWAILKFMYPKADIPVIALSLDMAQPADYHYELGKSMKFLREQGILVLGAAI